MTSYEERLRAQYIRAIRQVTDERDRARDIACALEAEVAVLGAAVRAAMAGLAAGAGAAAVHAVLAAAIDGGQP